MIMLSIALFACCLAESIHFHKKYPDSFRTGRVLYLAKFSFGEGVGVIAQRVRNAPAGLELTLAMTESPNEPGCGEVPHSYPWTSEKESIQSTDNRLRYFYLLDCGSSGTAPGKFDYNLQLINAHGRYLSQEKDHFWASLAVLGAVAVLAARSLLRFLK